jgi:hypothetical protein
MPSTSLRYALASAIDALTPSNGPEDDSTIAMLTEHLESLFPTPAAPAAATSIAAKPVPTGATLFVGGTGVAIKGTLELAPGIAMLDASSVKVGPGTDGNGEWLFDYQGGTEIDWDCQETTRRDGEIVFVDENDDEWLASQCSLIAVDSDDEA